MKKQPLAIFVAWHPDLQDGEDLANLVFREFKRNVTEPLARGMNIPVFFRYTSPLLDIPDEYEFTVVVALIDSSFKLDSEYRDFLQQCSKRSSKKFLLIPCAWERNVLDIPLHNKNFARFYDRTKPREYLVEVIAHEAARHLYGFERISASQLVAPPPPLKLFISHAKADGVTIASSIKAYVEKSHALKTFFDANDIAIGYDFSDEIERHIQDAVIIAIHTDLYSTREWCRREVLLAKQHNRPIVVLNCLHQGESRSFPYMANVLTVHFPSLGLAEFDDTETWGRLLSAVLKETLRLKYLELWIAFVIQQKGILVNKHSISAYPPELVTVLTKMSTLNNQFIYPDPPLGSEELALLSMLNPAIRYQTPSAL